MASNGELDTDALHLIKEDDFVVLQRGDVYKAVQIQRKKKVIFEKQWLFLDNAVGQVYGSVFEVGSGGSLQPRRNKPSRQECAESRGAGMDNRNIVDDGRSQKLTREDIETLKEQGLKGQEIVQQLVENSTTFKDKTEFAQEKYIKKKKRKYENTITVRKPTTRILAVMYHAREPGKICHLRYDTLAQMLTLGNIHAGCKVLVFETCAGLLLGAVMERMGGHGWVVQFYPGGGPLRAATDSLGLPQSFQRTLHDFPLSRVNALLNGTLFTRDAVAMETEETSQSAVCACTADPQDKEQEERERRRESKAQEKRQKVEERRKRLCTVSSLLQNRNADGLLIASRFQPSPILMALLTLLAPSRPFVVYSQYREPLVECYTKLRESGGVINLRLSETWLRHYQVLPNRTHPMLLMSGGGGYLLSGMTVEKNDESQTTGAQKPDEPQNKRIKLDQAED